MSVVQTRQQTARARASAQARARALPPRSRPRAATTQIIKNINNMNKSNIDVDFIKSSSRTHFWHWNEEDESSQVSYKYHNLQKIILLYLVGKCDFFQVILKSRL